MTARRFDQLTEGRSVSERGCWELRMVSNAQEVRLRESLLDGWEPFAVTAAGQFVYHLRRWKPLGDAPVSGATTEGDPHG